MTPPRKVCLEKNVKILLAEIVTTSELDGDRFPVLYLLSVQQ